MDFKHKSKLPWLSHFIYSLKHRGLMNTCSLGLKEWKKERELGISTFGNRSSDELTISCNSKEGGHLYQPSSSVIFEKAMNTLPFNFKEKVFLDIGSGKGRALILAAESGFRKVIGIEYANELNDIAYTNVELVKDRFPNTEFHLEEGDALTYSIPSEVDVIYLFNPFDEQAISELMKRVKPHFKLDKEIYLVYVHPVHSPCVEEFLGKPISVITNRKGMPDVAIFCNRSA
ncbi:MAG: class I SAM-dependent methyltransferase [Flavobacteriales bacterium]|nr:class I SAM-dependent methyltransferase [Flavobacteriales bacterium]